MLILWNDCISPTWGLGLHLDCPSEPADEHLQEAGMLVPQSSARIAPQHLAFNHMWICF